MPMDGKKRPSNEDCVKPPPQPKSKTSTRAFHKKVRTGCRTCKIRRIRCDEAKPNCERCSSTGRVCDGYTTSASFPVPPVMWRKKPDATAAGPPPESPWSFSSRPNVLAERMLATNLQRTTQELRAHRYFLDVTGPSIAGALHTALWLYEIPRLSQHDQAIWHATVSLGSAHEAAVNGVDPTKTANILALRHFNAAIRELTTSKSKVDYWKALTLGAIFGYISVLEGHLDQARMHFRFGYNLIKGIEQEVLKARHQPALGVPNSDVLKSHFERSPVSPNSIRSVLVCFEMLETKLDNNRISQPPTLLSKDDAYCIWEAYSLQERFSPEGRTLSIENLSKAIEAAESLFMALIISCSAHGQRLRAAYQEHGYTSLASVPMDWKRHAIGFREIQRALTLFRSEIEVVSNNIRPTALTSLRKGYLGLCLTQATSRFLMPYDPEYEYLTERQRQLPELCKHICDTSETLLDMRPDTDHSRNGSVEPTIMNPLMIVAKSGFGRVTRQRAIDLLRRQRMEGVWDTRMAAGMSEAMMRREGAANREYSHRRDLDGILIVNPTSRAWDGGNFGEDAIHPLARVCNVSMAYTSARSCKFYTRTWKEWLCDEQGEESAFSW